MNRETRERLRTQAIGGCAATATAPPAPTAAKAPALAQAAPAPTKLTWLCGHELDLTQLTKTRCGPCRDKVRQEKAACKREKRDAKYQAKRIAAQNYAERLPDGARFDVTYDAATQTWSGTLVIGALTLTASKSGVFKLLQELDRQYREAQGQEKSSGC